MSKNQNLKKLDGINLNDLSDHQRFYDEHLNFSGRRLTEYNISPGIKCKFDTILKRIGAKKFNIALDVGCSGNSLIHFIPNIEQRVFLDIAHPPMIQYSQFKKYHPSNGTITNMPFKNEIFDLITALDVLEHIPDDDLAANEIVRILKPKGILLVTVPHRMKYYTNQDALVGHYRRYEYEQIKNIFKTKGLRELVSFGVYGQIMKIAFIQETNPKKTEESLNNLRRRYTSDNIFRIIWDKIVLIGSLIMKIDAKIQPFNKIMDICLIFKKL